SLNAVYGLFGILPMLALPLLLGGVTGGEFWRMTLALINALLFSLAAGIMVSALARDTQTAMGRTLGLMIILVFGLPLVGAGLQPGGWAGFGTVINRASPLAPFSSSSDILYTGHEGRFWGAFAASELLTWLFLVVAVWALPRFWHEQPVAEGSWFKRV